MAAVAASSRKLEQNYEIPVAPISTLGFKPVVEDDRKSGKLPLPFIFTPHPVIGLSPEALDRYIVGHDPETGRPVIDEIVEVLTKDTPHLNPPVEKGPGAGSHPQGERVSPAERKPERVETWSRQVEVSGEASEMFLKPDTEDNLQLEFYRRGWTDGLPVILPTEERMKKMLAGTSAAPDEVVGEVFQFNTRRLLKYKVSNIAVIAVMAGAQPEYLPVLLALASTKHPALMPSTTPFEAMILVNGPIRNDIAMNSGIGAFSAVNMANSVIGRAWTLMSICFGYAKPRVTLWSSQGNNHTYNNMCAAENEERSVWTPFHVSKGFKPEESVVSVFRGWTMLNSTGAAANRSVTEELNIQLAVMPPLNSSATIIMDPLVARNLKENEGFSTKQDYARHLSQNVKMPAGQYWKTDYVDMLVASSAYKGIEPYASWKKLPDEALIAPYHNPDNINIVVVGGETSPLWKTADYGYVASASIDKWKAAKSSEECPDGTCGLPDEPGEYDD